MLDPLQDVLILLLEFFVGLASFTGCLVAVDKLYLFYATVFYKGMAMWTPEWEPTLRYPRRWNHRAKTPRVCVQLPMFNETFVARRVIDHACCMEYPKHQLYIQILDDSTDAATRAVVDDGIAFWKEQGFIIEAIRRTNRQGYKAGAMHEVHNAITSEFIAIFDADFLPEKDFLMRTIPVFQDKNVGFVQGRWTYLNASESLFCRYQEICLNAHIKCEQYARFSTGNFLNFNGTGGVWRKACIDSAGGWNARTLVEDMDLSLRAFLKGWHFVWRHDVKCPNEIPSDYKAYRKQQRRWSCGPMQLWAAARHSVAESRLPTLHKAYLNIFFFGVRMLATNVISFTFYSVLVPLILLVYATEDLEEAVHHRFMPWWSIVWLPLLVTMTTMAFSPKSFHYMILYVMYENAMSILKLGASLEGLLGLQGSMTWTVTQKLGSQVHAPLDLRKVLSQMDLFPRELAVGLFLMTAAMYGYYVRASWVFTVYFFTQGLIFLIFSLSLVEAFNLQPPDEAQLLGLVRNASAQLTPSPSETTKPPQNSTSRLSGPYHSVGTQGLTDLDDEGAEPRDLGTTRPERHCYRGGAKTSVGNGPQGSADGVAAEAAEVRHHPPALVHVLGANVIIFLYALPINLFSILLLYGVTTMALSEILHTQYDDVVALFLALFVVPLHMFWCLGSPLQNWADRKLARQGRLPAGVKIKHWLQLALLYFYLFMLFLISMYSSSATLQDFVSREVYHLSGKWLEEYIDRR